MGGDLLRRFDRSPLLMAKALWPHVEFWGKQREVLEAVRTSHETIVVAGNQLGKDFCAGGLVVLFFLRPQAFFPEAHVRQVEASKDPTEVNPHFVRVLTTSVRQDHLDVLWGEIRRFVQTCSLPLTRDRGGPLKLNDLEVTKFMEDGRADPKSYVKGLVSKEAEGMAGHHAPYTLVVGDEASSISDEFRRQCQGWAKRMLWIGNPNPCQTFFQRDSEAGDLLVS